MRYILVVLALCLLVTSSQAGTFKDDFNDGNFDGWGKSINACPQVKSEWKIDNGILISRYPIGCGSGLLFGKPEWRNYSIECDAKMVEILADQPGGYVIGLGLRVHESFLGIYCIVGKFLVNAEASIQLWTDIFTLAKSSLKENFRFQLDRWYHLKAVANEENFEFYVDGELLISMKDSRSPTGYLDLHNAGAVVYFDNVVITGDDVPDNSQAVASQGKLATSWGRIRSQ